MNIEIQNRLNVFSGKDKVNPEGEEYCKEVVIMAKDFLHGNFNAGKHEFGKDIIIDGGGKGPGFAYYSFMIPEDGFYDIWSRYASNESRPVDIWLKRTLTKKGALNAVTGGWTARFLKWHKEFTIELEKGEYFFEIRSSKPIPHIERFAIFKSGEVPEYIRKEEKHSYIKIISRHLSENGPAMTLKKFIHYLIPYNLIDRYLEVVGIYDGEYGYKGPFHVQIDLTNNCNNSCIACWCNSPLLKEKRLSSEKKSEYLPLSLVKELLDDISLKGAKEVYYSGSGEPFTHPQIIEILRYTKEKKLTCHVNTNFTLLDKQKMDSLIDIGVDFLTVSTWAGTAETYAKTHPGRTEEDFYEIKDNLIYLNTRKKDRPRIKLYNVIFNMNYFEVEKMVEFAAETQSESLEFTIVDTIPGATDILALNKKELGELKEAMSRIESVLDKNSRVRNSNVLLFQFNQFLRRIYIAEDVKEAKYDRNIIDSMPCYIAWLFARIIPNGEFHSCLKSHRIPTGSLYKNRFLEIWNSQKQSYFRRKALVYKKDDPFFRFIGNDCNIKEAGCYKSCDDIGRNTWMHGRMKSLTLPERILLKCVARILKAARNLAPKKEVFRKYGKDPVTAGISHGRKAFIGPEQVVVDPTNMCNLKCSVCWLYSPFLKDAKPSSDFLKKELPKETLIRLVDDLSLMGTKRIRFTGGGEPFMHKGLMDVARYALSKKLLVAITTNFGLVSKKDIQILVESGLEELCVSLWASDPDTYKAVHLDCPDGYFEKVKENLAYLKEIKKTSKPRLTFSNVILNTNYKNFRDMYEFAKIYKADAVYFTLADVFGGETDRFLLEDRERDELLKTALEIKGKAGKDHMHLEFYDGFIRRLSKRGEDFKKGEYDKADVDKIPCYAGWIFSRVLADGSVAPCCRGVKKIMGNVNERPFKDIWFSEKYDEFRAKAKFLPKDNIYFRDIGCVKECDNLMHNIEIHKKICPEQKI
jgi:MoaA/NifB/PqqE/SkfB family radical SAM enzyme